MRDAIARLIDGERLNEASAQELFRAILHGHADEAQLGAVLAVLQARGVTVDELVGAARVMREVVTPVPARADDGRPIVDTCGTGGAPKTFNVSTAAAIVAAAAEGPKGERVRVAKHGNRSRTGRGSAEILDRLGVNLDASPESQARCLEEAGVCFCFAMRHHPAMRHAAGPRKALGFPTIFNLLGPLTNPAGAAHQLLGVYDRDAVRPMAEALAALGTKRAIVAHGLDGLDEMTTTTGTLLCEVEDGVVIEREAVAEDFGLERATLEDLQAGDLDEAERAIRDVLAGERGPKLDLAIWNAAGALAAGEIAEDLAEGLDLARDAVESGAAERTLERLAAVSREG